MKTALILIIAAILLSTGTILWSARQKVQRAGMVMTTCMTEVEPVRQMTSSQFFPSEKVHTVDVAVPVNVELDETFTGVELIGDTTLFKYIQVTVNDYRKAPGSISVKFRPLQTRGFSKDGNYFIKTQYGGDGIARNLVAAANITARIGIGQPEDLRSSERNFHFRQCRTITTKSPLSGEFIRWETTNVDTVIAHFEVKNLNYKADLPVAPDNRSNYMKLTGHVSRVNYLLYFTHLDAGELFSTETYFTSVHQSDIHVFASNIFNVNNLSDTDVKLSGNPKYRRIKAEDQSMITEEYPPTGNN